MNIFHKVTLHCMKGNRTRTIVTIIGVILSSAMVTAVMTFGVSLLDYMMRGACVKYGTWHVECSDITAEAVNQLMQDSMVTAAVTFDNLGYAPLVESINKDKPFLFIAGFHDETFTTLPLHLLEGRLPENDSELLISASIASNGGVEMHVGDTITLPVGFRREGQEQLSQHDSYRGSFTNVSAGTEGEVFIPCTEKTYTIVGICTRPSFEEYSAPGYTVITRIKDDSSQELNLSAFLTLQNPLFVRSFLSKECGNYDSSLNDNVLRFLGVSDDNLFNVLLYSVGGIVIAIIMTGSVFLIYNAFHISLNERMHQFGILASVGATAKQLRESVLFEGACIGVIGIPLGILVGLGSMKIILLMVADNFQSVIYDGVALTLRISFPILIISAIVSFVTIQISAYLPAKKAAATPIMDCIKQSTDSGISGNYNKNIQRVERLYGFEGALAWKNFNRNKKRVRGIVLSLALSVVLFISASSFVIYLTQASERAVVFTTYDLALATDNMTDSDMMSLYESLKNVTGITQSSYQYLYSYSAMVSTESLSECANASMTISDHSAQIVSLSADVLFLDDETYRSLLNETELPYEDYYGENAKMIAVAKLPGREDRVEEVDQFVNLFANDSETVTIDGLENPIVLDFVDLVPPDQIPSFTQKEITDYTFVILAPISLRSNYTSASIPLLSKGLTFSSTDATKSADAMQPILDHLSKDTTSYQLYNMKDLMGDGRNYIFITNVFAYTFIFMISLIAIANVFNTISTNIHLRKREFAMLRSVGMGERDFRKMMNFECAFYGIRALLFGLPIALLSSVGIYFALFAGGADNIEFTLPWGSIVISIVSVLAIVFITMLYATHQLKKENIIDALRSDME